MFGLQGTPGCRLNRWPDDDLYRSAGVRYITTDRAGYGQSSRHRGRTVADEASDVLAVADALGIERFCVVGGSGGGPHALACAALLARRVERVACQSSVAPLGEGGMTRDDWLEGMSAEIALELEWAEAGEEVLQLELVAAQRRMQERIAFDPGSLFGEDVSESDRDFLLRPNVVEAFTRIVAEQSSHGVGGSVDDTLAFSRAWGFDLAAIAVPGVVDVRRRGRRCPGWSRQMVGSAHPNGRGVGEPDRRADSHAVAAATCRMTQRRPSWTVVLRASKPAPRPGELRTQRGSWAGTTTPHVTPAVLGEVASAASSPTLEMNIWSPSPAPSS